EVVYEQILTYVCQQVAGAAPQRRAKRCAPRRGYRALHSRRHGQANERAVSHRVPARPLDQALVLDQPLVLGIGALRIGVPGIGVLGIGVLGLRPLGLPRFGLADFGFAAFGFAAFGFAALRLSRFGLARFGFTHRVHFNHTEAA